MSIPYMGSKRKLAPAIIDHIIEHNPNAKYFFDLFGGGGAVSFEALRVKKFEKVFYRDYTEKDTILEF
jgi:site-specific DNA-adenine methylase